MVPRVNVAQQRAAREREEAALDEQKTGGRACRIAQELGVHRTNAATRTHSTGTSRLVRFRRV